AAPRAGSIRIESASAAADSPPGEASATAGATAEGDAARAPAPAWVILEGDEPRRSRAWLFGSIAAAALLALQVTHHYRAQLAATAIVGPWVRDAYAFLGSEVAPRWDLAQYEVLEWTAI